MLPCMLPKTNVLCVALFYVLVEEKLKLQVYDNLGEKSFKMTVSTLLVADVHNAVCKIVEY